MDETSNEQERNMAVRPTLVLEKFTADSDKRLVATVVATHD